MAGSGRFGNDDGHDGDEQDDWSLGFDDSIGDTGEESFDLTSENATRGARTGEPSGGDVPDVAQPPRQDTGVRDGMDESSGGEVVAFPGFAGEPTGVFGPDDDLDDGDNVDDQADRAAYASDDAPAGTPADIQGASAGAPADDDDFSDISTDPFESFTEEQYRASTTREYRGLAEAIEQSAREGLAPQAVSAAMPGVATGVVGFDDMTGEEAADLEAMHAEERVQRGDLFLRVGTAVGLVAVLVGALLAGGAWIALLLGLVVVLSLGEFYASVRRAGYVPVALFGFLGSIGLLIGAWRSGPFAIGGFLAATGVAVSLWFALVPRRNPLDNAVITLLGVGWIAALLAFAYPIFQSGDLVPLTGALVVLTALFDVASYFVGKGVGRRALAPVLSPNKTVEGLLGGVVITIAAGAGIGASGLVEPFTLASGLALGIAVSVFAPIGDLSESLVKRLIGVKDMGSILPGHGGMLDRVDGFIFSIPAAYLVYLWFGYLQ